MIRRLKIKFVCINMLIVTLMLVMIFSLVLHNTSRDMENQAYRTIERIQEMPFGIAPQRGEITDSFFIVHYTSQGEVHLFARGAFEDYDRQELLEIGNDARKSGKQNGVLPEENLRFARKKGPGGEMLAFVDTVMEGRILKGLFINAVKIFLVSFSLFLVVSILLAQWAIRPVEKAWNTQRQFVADASHELKTPLTVIMTNAEILQDQNSQPQPDQFVQNILDMSRQMRGLVEGLLNLARVDNGIVKTAFSEVDFSTLVSNCLLPFEPVIYEKNMELEAEVMPGLLIHGSETHLRQVVDILLDNAVKYGGSEKPVSIRLSRQGKHALLCVTTAGEALSAQDLKNIFKRFYRVDKARSMNHSYGLGLSIAQGIVQDHRGKIWAESKNEMNSFFVQIPCLH